MNRTVKNSPSGEVTIGKSAFSVNGFLRHIAGINRIEGWHLKPVKSVMTRRDAKMGRLFLKKMG